jgi:hypothetical protein
MANTPPVRAAEPGHVMQALNAAERIDYDEGWFYGATGAPAGERWPYTSRAWRQGHAVGIRYRPTSPWPEFRGLLNQHAGNVVGQATLFYLREPPIPPPDRELDPADQLDRQLLDLMREGSEPVTPDGSVFARVIDTDAELVIRSVLAGESRIPGAVGAWLDRLPRNRRVVVPAVASARLYGMLQRRGFHQGSWYDIQLGMFDRSSMIREPT